MTTKVFIGGSRRVSRINKHVKKRLDQIIQNEYTIIIGDANGTDRCVQDYLFGKNYGNVLVFCMGSKCRNNIGNWQIRSIQTAESNRDFHYYSTKDLEMVKEADYGFMIWDGRSKGTLGNIVYLLKECKKISVYFSPERNFYTLVTTDDLEKILAKCEPKSIEIFEKELKLSKVLNLSNKRTEPIQLALQLTTSKVDNQARVDKGAPPLKKQLPPSPY